MKISPQPLEQNTVVYSQLSNYQFSNSHLYAVIFYFIYLFIYLFVCLGGGGGGGRLEKLWLSNFEVASQKMG